MSRADMVLISFIHGLSIRCHFCFQWLKYSLAFLTLILTGIWLKFSLTFSVEEALIEMYLAGISVRRVEDISEALWGAKVSPGTISNLNKKVYAQIEEWRNRPLVAEYPYMSIWMESI